MTWTASLPMYDLSPRLRQGYDALLAALLAQAGIADAVAVARDGYGVPFWLRSDLLLSQTCGYPYVTALRGHVTLLATPRFDVPGCGGGDYTSVLLTRAGSGIATLADARGGVAAANDVHSHSGMNALRHAVAPLAADGRFFGAVRWTGSHAGSAMLVRDGEADIAALDCVTYAYLCADAPHTVAGLVTLGYTAPCPGLPFIAGRAVPPAVAARLRAALLAPDSALQATFAPLRIAGFDYRGDAEYERVAALEHAAVALGYPALR